MQRKQLLLFPLDSFPVEGDVATQQGEEELPKEAQSRWPHRRPLKSCLCCKGHHRLKEVTLGETQECQQRDFDHARAWWEKERKRWLIDEGEGLDAEPG